MIGSPARSRRAYINAHVLAPMQGLNGPGGIIVEDGWILAVGKSVTRESVGSTATVVDCKGRLLIPGLVDMRVFTGEPGTEYRETLATASDAAAAGGVTTIIVMPNTKPVIDDAAIVDYVLRRARDTAKVRVAPMAAITKGLAGEQMAEIGLLRRAGAVAVTDAVRAVTNANIFRRALTYARDFDMLVVGHAEEPTLSGGVMNAGEMASRLGLSGIPAMSEVIMLERDLRLVEMTGARYHVAQVSSALSLDVIRRAKDKGLPVTCGVSIHHLVLNETDIGAYRTFFKLTPPLRSEDDRRALVAAVADGTIDVIVSSHDPQSDDTKRLPFGEAAFGAVGLETMLSSALSLSANENIALPRLVEALSQRPAAILGLEQGRLQPGAPADFTVVDPTLSWKVEDASLRSRSKNSPYEHRTLEGRAVETVVAGRSVYEYAS
ncbi:dihydroorotase [Aestuariivirga sp.]|uniref:dihydroorotase n=1 Tax=Aestuariivirga sp. TaxID=2650926 RepID=UPI0039E35D68